MALGNMFGLAKQAQKIQSEMKKIQKQLEETDIEGTAGGGAVTVIMKGNGDVKRITINDAYINKEEKDILEDLIVAACRDAKTKVQALSQDMAKDATGGLDLSMFAGQ